MFSLNSFLTYPGQIWIKLPKKLQKVNNKNYKKLQNVTRIVTKKVTKRSNQFLVYGWIDGWIGGDQRWFKGLLCAVQAENNFFDKVPFKILLLFIFRIRASTLWYIAWWVLAFAPPSLACSVLTGDQQQVHGLQVQNDLGQRLQLQLTTILSTELSTTGSVSPPPLKCDENTFWIYGKKC